MPSLLPLLRPVAWRSSLRRLPWAAASRRHHSRFQELRSSNDLLERGDEEQLQRRMQEDGYLLLRSILDRRLVLDLRREIVRELRHLELVDQEQPDMQHGTMISQLPPSTQLTDPHDWKIFDRVQKLESFHSLPHSPRLFSLLSLLFRDRVLMHPRHICRVHFPRQDQHRTLPHQDFPYVQGSQRTVTCWCPAGDVTREHGPLAVLVGSNKFGMKTLIRHSDSVGAPFMVDASSLTESGSCFWGTTDFKAGDVLLFTPFTIHMGLENRTSEVRISLDCRAQPASDVVSERALQPNWTRQTWEEIYDGWESDELKFYWKKMKLEVVKEEDFSAVAFQTTFDPMNY